MRDLHDLGDGLRVAPLGWPSPDRRQTCAVLSLGFAPDTARRYQGFLRSTPMLGWLGLYIAWQLFDFIFDPVFTAAANLLYPGVSYG